MKGKTIILLAIMAMFMIAAGAFTSVFAGEDESTLTVKNNTDHDVRVEIYGIDDATYGESDSSAAEIFVVPAGGTKNILLDNDETYYYLYWACGPNPDDTITGDNPSNVISGEIDMEDDQKIIIDSCKFTTAHLQVANHLGDTVEITFIHNGDDEVFEIEPGLTIVTVFAGLNFYSYDACDTDFNGEFEVKANGRSKFYVRSCEWHASPARIYGGLNPVNFTLVNHASFPMILTLLGPENYLVTVQPGENRVRLIAGSYEYRYYMDFAEMSGNFFVPETGNGRAIFSPSYTIDNGNFEDEFE